jgi:phage gpG-like protein
MPVHQSGVSMQQLQRKLAQLARSGTVPKALHQNLAQEARKQVFDEFKQGRDPYGRAWAKTIRGGVILAKSGRLRNSLRPVATSVGFTITTPVVYAAVHQHGAVIHPNKAKALRFKVNGQWVTKRVVLIPRRQYLPERSTGGLGPIWTPAFRRVINSYVRTFMRLR